MIDNKSNSYDIVINLVPWTELGYTLKELSMEESIGGELAKGEASFFLEDLEDDNSLRELTNQKYGIIKIGNDKGGGMQYKPIPLFITSRSWTENFFNIKFTCISDNLFYDKTRTADFSDINEALSQLYPNSKNYLNIESKCDINNKVKIFQPGETNYDLCTRLCYSFKHNSIFGYGWEGLFIKDIPEKGVKLDLTGGIGNISAISPYELRYSYVLNEDPEDMEMDTEFSKGMFDAEGNHYIMGTDYYQLVENYIWNKRFVDNGFRSSVVVKGTDMPLYKLGDTIGYSRAYDESKLPFNRYIVASNELYYSTPGIEVRDPNDLNFSWTTTLFGLDTGGWSKEDEEK